MFTALASKIPPRTVKLSGALWYFNISDWLATVNCRYLRFIPIGCHAPVQWRRPIVTGSHILSLNNYSNTVAVPHLFGTILHQLLTSRNCLLSLSTVCCHLLFGFPTGLLLPSHVIVFFVRLVNHEET